MKRLMFLLLIALFAGSSQLSARATDIDRVQAVLKEWHRLRPDLVGLLPEQQRYYLLKAGSAGTPEELIRAVQEAFYLDYSPVCQQYGNRYLLDWPTLLAKAARETFWGTSLLSNRARNYFGLRTRSKEWMCSSFSYCSSVSYRDPEPAEFAVFPNFEASLWMFIHTIYAAHYLERLPDRGERVVEAILYEKRTGHPYWRPRPGGQLLTFQLPGRPYRSEEMIYTWSGHEMNNLCINCDRQSDWDWVGQVLRVAERLLDKEPPREAAPR